MAAENRITIVTICDNHYMMMLAALIKSIEINYRSTDKIDLYIVEDNVSERNKKKLIASVNPELVGLYWLKMSEVIPPNLKLPLDYSSFPLNIYARLFIAYFIPSHLEKVLYLDVDMIVLEDISKLWKTDLEDKIIAGVVDRAELVSCSWAGILNYRELGIPADTKYFNSGLLLINTVKWRNSEVTNKIITCVKDNMKFANFPDQYGLNVIFANQWVELDPRWNSQAMLSLENPYLIHFTGRKPIYTSYNYNEHYKNEFYKYLQLTEWKNYTPVGEYRRLLKKIYNKFEKIRFIKKV